MEKKPRTTTDKLQLRKTYFYVHVFMCMCVSMFSCTESHGRSDSRYINLKGTKIRKSANQTAEPPNTQPL